MTHCRLSNGFGTTPKSKPPAWMGVHKTVNGAYRYRYAPFLMSTYYVMGRSPLALPLGELSPQVTERVLPPFLNNKINLCAHTVCPLRPRRARSPLPQGEARDTHTVHRKVHRSARFICPSAAITALERSSGKHRMAAGTETVLRPPSYRTGSFCYSCSRPI